MKTISFCVLMGLLLSPILCHAQDSTNLPPPTVVMLRAADAYATEPCASSLAPDRGVFVLSRSANTNIDLHVSVALGGMASNGVDYVSIPTELVIPKGRWAIEIPVTGLGDNLAEGVENVVMRIRPIACIAIFPPPPECYQVGTPSEAVVHLADCGITNPPPITVTVHAPDPAASEPCLSSIDRGVFVISRDSNTNIDLAIRVSLGGTASNGLDYASIPQELVIPKGRWAIEIPVTALADNLSEGVENAVIHILPPFCPQTVIPLPPECYRVGTPSEAVVKISDCQSPPPAVVTIRAADPYASESCVSTVLDAGVFVISRSANTNIAMAVNLAISGTASNGLDYLRITNRVVIPAGKWALEVPVKPISDNLPEGPENVVMRILPPLCAETVVPLPPECYLIGQPAEAVVYIRECSSNRPPIVHITTPTNGQAFAAPARIPIRVETKDPDGYCWKAEFFNGSQKIGERTKNFLVAPTNGAMIPFEFAWTNVPAGLYTITVRATDSAGVIGLSEPVRVSVGQPPVTDKVPEVSIVATEPLAIEGTNCWSWSNETNRYPVSTAQTPTYSVAQGTAIWWFTNCGPKNATFTIRRSGATNADLRVFYFVRGTATNGVDYEMLPESVVIPAGSRKAQILVVPKEDDMPEAVETVIIGLMHPPYASPLPPPYVIVSPARAAAVIVDSSNPQLPTGPLPDRSFYVGGTALDGSWFRIERSRDMVNWEVVCTNQVTEGAVRFVDPDAVDNSQQFYRAVPASEPVD